MDDTITHGRATEGCLLVINCPTLNSRQIAKEILTSPGWGVEEGSREGSKMGVNKAGTPWEVESAESAGTSGAAESASMTAGGADAKGEAKEEWPAAVFCAAAAGMKTEGVG
ncbi:MAG: hypothetical protein FRX49_05304 [Trebouxia sp. A1-2]|nr:MAG: hypothetical protein FRX49_05304 [Trebouxia sp. A1-2]